MTSHGMHPDDPSAQGRSSLDAGRRSSSRPRRRTSEGSYYPSSDERAARRVSPREQHQRPSSQGPARVSGSQKPMSNPRSRNSAYAAGTQNPRARKAQATGERAVHDGLDVTKAAATRDQVVRQSAYRQTNRLAQSSRQVTAAGRAASADKVSRQGNAGLATRPKSTNLSSREDRRRPASSKSNSRALEKSRYSQKGTRESNRGKKVLIGVAALLLVALVGAGAAFANFVTSIDNELAGGKTEEEMLEIEGALADRPNATDPFYMLLLGSDARANNSEMGARADTSIVARIDPKTNTVALISIPRDTMIYIDGSGPYKFNAAYSFRGTAGAIEAANELLDIEISHYAEVNFESLIELVDIVGGVEVEVPARIDDWKAGDVVIEKGLQTLDGEAALVFARSRDYADGDFTRTSNQRLLIEALAKKVLSLPVDQMPGVTQGAAKCVSTDLSATEIISLAMQFVDDDGDLAIHSIMVPSDTSDVDGVSYVVADKTGLKAVMKAIEAGEDPNSVETYGATGSSLGASQ